MARISPDLEETLRDVATDVASGFISIGGGSGGSFQGRIDMNVLLSLNYFNLLKDSELVTELEDPKNVAIFKRAGRLLSGRLSSRYWMTETFAMSKPEVISELWGYYKTLKYGVKKSPRWDLFNDPSGG